MNIVSELALSFDTKKRAPFRVVFETVKLSELKNGQFQQSETNEPESTQPDDHEERAIVNEESKELMNIINVTQADDIEQPENPFYSDTFRAPDQSKIEPFDNDIMKEKIDELAFEDNKIFESDI